MNSSGGKVEAVKEYLTEDRFRLKLHDLVAAEIRNVLSHTSEVRSDGPWSLEEFQKRLHLHEDSCHDLLLIESLLGFWGKEDQRNVTILSPKRLCAEIRPQSGLTIWLALRWYPALLLFYAGGIASIASARYDNLRELMMVSVPDYNQPNQRARLILSIGAVSVGLHDAFKHLPGRDKEYVPRSEYLYTLLQPIFEDLFLLGPDYESAFDRFEAFFALQHAFLWSAQGGRFWGPPGRFVWKLQSGGVNPIAEMLAEAQTGAAQESFLKSGLFAGSIDKFKEVLTQYRELIARSSW